MQKELFPYFPDGFFDGIKQRDKEREPFELRKQNAYLYKRIAGLKGVITKEKNKLEAIKKEYYERLQIHKTDRLPK